MQLSAMEGNIGTKTGTLLLTQITTNATCRVLYLSSFASPDKWSCPPFTTERNVGR